MISNLSLFLEEIDKRVNSKGFQWCGGNQEDNVPTTEASPFVMFTISAQWSFGIIKSSEILCKLVRTFSKTCL